MQENYFGDDQKFGDFETNVPLSAMKKSPVVESAGVVDGVHNGKLLADVGFDPNMYRPLHVTVELTVNDIQAHLVKVRFHY